MFNIVHKSLRRDKADRQHCFRCQLRSTLVYGQLYIIILITSCVSTVQLLLALYMQNKKTSIVLHSAIAFTQLLHNFANQPIIAFSFFKIFKWFCNTGTKPCEFSCALSTWHLTNNTIKLTLRWYKSCKITIPPAAILKYVVNKMAALILSCVVQQVTEAVGLNGTIHRMVQFFSVSGSAHASSTFYVSQY